MTSTEEFPSPIRLIPAGEFKANSTVRVELSRETGVRVVVGLVGYVELLGVEVAGSRAGGKPLCELGDGVGVGSVADLAASGCMSMRTFC